MISNTALILVAGLSIFCCSDLLYQAEQFRVLKTPRNPITSYSIRTGVGEIKLIEVNPSMSWMIDAAYAVEHAGLSRSVRTDKSQQFPLPNVERYRGKDS